MEEKRSSHQIKFIAAKQLKGKRLRIGLTLIIFEVIRELIVFGILALMFTFMDEFTVDIAAPFISNFFVGLFIPCYIYIALSAMRPVPFKASTLFTPYTQKAGTFLKLTLIYTLLYSMSDVITAVFFPNDWDRGLVYWLTQIGIWAVYFLISMNFLVSVYLLVDHPDMKLMDAFKKSLQLMKGNRGTYWGIFIGFFGLGIALGFAAGLILVVIAAISPVLAVFPGVLAIYVFLALWLVPYITTSYAVFYMDLTGEQDSIEWMEEQKKMYQDRQQEYPVEQDSY